MQRHSRLAHVSVLILGANIRSIPPIAWVPLSILVGVQRAIHRFPIKRPPANSAPIDISWPLMPGSPCAPHSWHPHQRGRRCHAQRPGRSQFNRIARREDLRRDGRTLHAVHTVGTMLACIVADCVQHKIPLGCLPKRIRLYTAHAAVIPEIDT